MECASVCVIVMYAQTGLTQAKPHAGKSTTYTSMVPLHLTLSITCMAGTNKGRGRGGGEKDKRGKRTEVSFALSLIPLIFSLPPDPIALLMPAHVHNHRHLYCGEFNKIQLRFLK